jgi:hypothetical protein
MERTGMKRLFSTRWGLLAGAAVCAGVAATPGCELIVDFDRTKIPLGGDASMEDATVPDGSSEDAASDAKRDTGPTMRDGGLDALPDSTPGADTGPDSTVADAADTGTPDTSVADTGLADAPGEAMEPDVGPEAAPPDDSGPDGADGS